MRILWFSVTPSLFNPHSNGHNGGGWISSLEKLVKQEKDIELGVAFHFPDNGFKYESDGVCYYPISPLKESFIDKLFGKRNEQISVEHYLKIIEDFKPDVIHIFGSENDFGLVCKQTNIPVVIHIQGCLPPYHNALFPVGLSKWDFIFQRGLSPRYRFIGLRSEQAFRKGAQREIDIIQGCKYFMGRTEWDKGIIDLFNPQATYFHCEEALRDSFIQGTKKWKYREDGKIIITSVISRPWYKGCDLILKTAALLKQFTNINFEWRVYGIPEMRFYEAKYKIKASEVNVRVMGTASKEELVEALCGASCYVHTSYIDNSPNSLCEAQILGVPVLATHVGGVSSLIKDGENGILFPANAPYTLASLIKRIAHDRKLAEELNRNAIKTAEARHNPNKIKERVTDIYKQIIKERK